MLDLLFPGQGHPDSNSSPSKWRSARGTNRRKPRTSLPNPGTLAYLHGMLLSGLHDCDHEGERRRPWWVWSPVRLSNLETARRLNWFAIGQSQTYANVTIAWAEAGCITTPVAGWVTSSGETGAGTCGDVLKTVLRAPFEGTGKGSWCEYDGGYRHCPLVCG